MGMVRPDVETMQKLAKRMTFSNAETARMIDWADAPLPKPDLEEGEFAKLLYRNSQQGILDKMRLEVVHLVNRDDEAAAQKMLELLNFAAQWTKPSLPLKGQDLLNNGAEAGPELGKALNRLEESWIESGFTKTKAELLSEA